MKIKILAGGLLSVLLAAGITKITYRMIVGAPVNVLDTGADSTGSTASDVAFSKALATASTAGVYVPCGTYTFVAAVTIPTGSRLEGQSKFCVTLLFTGATSGLVFGSGATVQDFAVEHLTLKTTNAAGNAALDMSSGTTTGGVGFYRFVLRDIAVLASGSGRWAYGLNAHDAESAEVDALSVFESATIIVYLTDSCNQLKFYNLEGTGGISTDATFNRGIWIDSPGTGMPEFFGGTMQGRFALGSALYVTGHNPAFYGMHFEVTVASGDVGDAVINGASDVTMYGIHLTGTLVLEGTIRGFHLDGGSVGAVTFGSTVQGAYLTSTRVASITDNGTVGSPTNNGNGWFNVRLTNGSLLRNKGLVEYDAPGATTATTATTPGNTAVSYANGTALAWRDSLGATQAVWQWTAADQLIGQYAAGKQITIRNNSSVNKLVINDTSMALQSGVSLVPASTTFSALGTPTAPAIFYCTDCTVANPCAGSGTGAYAKRVASAWVCN